MSKDNTAPSGLRKAAAELCGFVRAHERPDMIANADLLLSFLCATPPADTGEAVARPDREAVETIIKKRLHPVAADYTLGGFDRCVDEILSLYPDEGIGGVSEAYRIAQPEGGEG